MIITDQNHQIKRFGEPDLKKLLKYVKFLKEGNKVKLGVCEELLSVSYRSVEPGFLWINSIFHRLQRKGVELCVWPCPSPIAPGELDAFKIKHKNPIVSKQQNLFEGGSK